MASGEAEPLQYTTTALRVSIHCEGCKKKVKKVLHSIEGVYKVTVDAAQHKVTVTGNVEADALLRRLHKAGKQAALWPSPAPMAPVPEAKKPEEAAPAAVALAEAAGESSAKDASDAKPKDAEAKEKPPEKGDGKEKKPDKDKNAEKGDAAAKPSMDAKASTEPKETKKGSPETAKQDAAEEASADEPSGGGKKGKKNKKNKPKDGDEGEALTPAAAPAAPEKKPHQPPVPVPSPGPERPPHGAFPYYAQPVLSYNVAHPSSSVSYYAPTHGVPMHPMPPPPPPPPQVVPYGYPPYPAMVPVPAEFLYGPPGMRSSPPQESDNNMFNENSCSLM